MRSWCAGLLILLGAVPATAAYPGLKEARQRLLHGNYEEARARYEALAKNPMFKADAAVGVSKTWQAQGEYDKALAAVEAALKDQAKNPDLLARKAELLYERGRWDEAAKAADAALAGAKDHFLARWVRAQIYRDRGELRKADDEFRWFVRTYTQRSENDNDIKNADELILVALAGAENARWHSLSDQFDFILKTVYADALKADKDDWWAEYYAGMLLLEKHNAAEALESFGKAEEINAAAAEVLVGRGQAALEQLDFKDAEALAKRAMRVNPRLPAALRLKADVLLAEGDIAAALKVLERARSVNPRDEATLARVAACHFLEGHKKEFAAVGREVARHDSRPGPFYGDLAQLLDERRRFDDAEKFYKKSIELRPMLAEPRAGLGMLYMRMGREDEARKVLDQAFKADEFNIRVSNTLKVLRHLDRYDKLQTAHFLIRFDPDNDKVLARYMAKYLEEIYSGLSSQFRYRPKGPILIELFNKHEMFSGRVIALPDLHTIGACTGRMFAMVSPRDRSKVIRKPFNWARVLRHEMVHIFNLEQTNFQVPHWYTEGLAVLNEGFPRPPSWNRLLLKRFPDKLLNLGTVNQAFMRPGTEEWTLAYLQSLLYVQYMKERFGPQTVGGLLQAYRDGLDTPAALRRVCKVGKDEFEKGYRVYVEGVVKQLKGKVADKPGLSLEALERAHLGNPGDLDVAARLAERYLATGDKKQALKLAREVLAKKKNQPLASYVQARLLRDAGEEDKAIALLQAAVDPDNPELKVLGLLGEMYYEGEKYPKAAEVFELARKADPYETRWLVELAKVYTQTRQNAKLIDVLKELAPTDADDLAVRKRLAELLLKADRPREAERYARQALEINVLDPEAQDFLRQALRKQKKTDQLKELDELLGPQKVVTR